ncbi:OmpA family protein [candidate division GN15 bacterium]|nr:OmpA family protein [candidate division GN15 bacterium]
MIEVDFSCWGQHRKLMHNRPSPRSRLLAACIAVMAGLLLAPSLSATDYKYGIGGGGGIVSFSGGDFFSFESQETFGISLGHRLGPGWWFDIEYSEYEFANDTDTDSTSSFGDIANNSPLELSATRLGASVSRSLFGSESWLNLTAGAGGGLMIWRGVNPETNTTYTVTGSKDQTTDFSASELFLSGQAGILVQVAPQFSLHLIGRADYLTGAGTDLNSDLASSRDRWLLGGLAKLYVHFGRVETWKSDRTWSRPVQPQPGIRAGRDSDGDGVPDDEDKCINTPWGADVSSDGCPLDTDRDGVPNGLDHCPGTPIEARGLVDINGCAVDSDLDGIADYLDNCPQNMIGGQVDSVGCPIDSDGDGIPDGLDDCPFTLVGVEVDKHGCIDLAMFAQPMVLNIQYAPGSFEVDPHNLERLRRLAGLLNFVQDIKLDINGYTDNIGESSANRSLSQKRADRVKEYLVTMGVSGDRIKTFGRGETNFVASNQTAEGRSKNRRIEIVFYK